MTFVFQTLHLHSNDMISVRVVAQNGGPSPCGTLVFTTDEWLAFNALVLGRLNIAGVALLGVEEVMERLRQQESSTIPPPEHSPKL